MIEAVTYRIDPDQAAAYELAYKEGFRLLEEQRAGMDGYRARAGLLLSAAAISTSFLGGAALSGGASPLAWVAICCFLSLGAGVVLILWPPRARDYVVRPARLIESYAEPDFLPLPLIHRDLAFRADAEYIVDRRRLERLASLFRGCSVLVITETVAWVLDLVSNRVV